VSRKHPPSPDYDAIVTCDHRARLDCVDVPVFGRPADEALGLAVAVAHICQQPWHLPHTAVLGLGTVRLAASKVYVALWRLCRGRPEQVELPLSYVVRVQQGELDGHRWAFRFSERRTVLELIDADRRRWEGAVEVKASTFPTARRRRT
jgi:hypothetical protein